MTSPTPSEVEIRDFLRGLTVVQLRALAVDMRYRWEGRRSELIDFLVRYRPPALLHAMQDRDR
jgi:hypothetical protein